MKSRKRISIILALAMVLSLFAAMPLTASAADGSNNTTIDLEDLTGDIAVGTYTNWSFVAATNTITVTDDVTIIGTKTGATQTLEINITNSKTVTWNASLEGNIGSNSSIIDP